jgi:hypothetical protein
MISTAPPDIELDPLASEPLCERFPHLRAAMDGESMQGQLQSALFSDGDVVVEARERPKAELSEDTCSLQYPLRLRDRSGRSRELLVLGTMFARAEVAATFHRDSLLPLAAGWSSRDGFSPMLTAVIEGLGLALSVFPVTASLPALISAYDAGAMAYVMRRCVAGAPAIREIELVVIRRTRGCVLRYRLDSAAHPVVYGKVGYSAQSTAMREALDALDGDHSRGDGNGVRLPRILGQDRALELTVVAEMPGTKPDLREPAQARGAVDAAAHAAALLHASAVQAGTARTLKDELERARAAVGLIGTYAPALSRWLLEVTDAAEAMGSTTAAGEPGFAHGDLTPSQLLLDGARVGILDFDKLCQAEAALDLGRFLAYLRFALAKHRSGDAAALAARFAQTYASAGGRPVTEARVEAYALASAVRMAARSWLQLKPSRLRVVCDVLGARVRPPTRSGSH